MTTTEQVYFYLCILKSILFRIIPEKNHSVGKTGGSASATSRDWIWSLPSSEKGRRQLLSASLQTPDEPRCTCIMHEVIWKSCMKSLSCDYLSSLKKKFKKTPVTTSNNIYLPVIPVLCIQKNSYIFFTLSSKSSIWKAIKRYPQIFVCERLDFLISVADRYEATSHRGKEKSRENKSSQPSVRHFTA